MVGIIDINLGNIRAVEKALDRLSIQHILLSREGSYFENCTHFILPGVGHFGAGMTQFRETGMINIIREHVLNKRRPILGICLGMQLLASHSDEGKVDGLGFVGGTAKLINPPDAGARVPHVGWNKLVSHRESQLLDGIHPDERFYFVHSYAISPTDCNRCVSLVPYYGADLCAVIEEENILGVQFHPEKSHEQGLRILNNFYTMYG